MVMIINWTSEQEVLDASGVTPYDDVDTDWLARCVEAVNYAISYWRSDLTANARSRSAFSKEFSREFARQLMVDNPMVKLGATMLAQRYYRRRNGEQQATFEEFGSMLSVSLDPDIQQMICLGRHHHSVVA